MTVCGLAVADGVGFAWADAEAYEAGGAPARESVQKLGVSASGFVGIGTGDLALTDHWRDSIEFSHGSLEQNISFLRNEMRCLSERRKRYRARIGESYELRTTVAALAFERGRFRGLMLVEREDFVPHEIDCFQSPRVSAQPRSVEEVLMIALEQMRELRRFVPQATGRALEIAKLGPRGVARARVPLVAADFVR